MRLSAFLFLVSLAGIVFGASLIGTWAIGLAIIVDSVAVGTFALLRDSGPPPQAAELLAAREAVRERARQAL